MVKSELLFGHPDLLSFLNETSNLFLDLFRVSGTEQDILDQLVVRKVFAHDLLEHFEVFILSEKPVGFVNDNALEVREVGGHFSSFQTILKFAKSCNNDVSVGLASGGKVFNSDVGKLTNCTVHRSNLCRELFCVANAKDLNFGVLGVDAKH